MPVGKTTQQDPTLTARLVRLRTALFNVARWRDRDGSAVCFCDSEGRTPHSAECEEAADALGFECGHQAVPSNGGCGCGTSYRCSTHDEPCLACGHPKHPGDTGDSEKSCNNCPRCS